MNICSQCIALQRSSLFFFKCPTVSCAKEELRENQSKCRLGEAAGSRAERSPPPPPAEEPGWDHLAGHVECCHELGDGVVVLREWVSRLIIRSAQASPGRRGAKGLAWDTPEPQHSQMKRKQTLYRFHMSEPRPKMCFPFPPLLRPPFCREIE